MKFYGQIFGDSGQPVKKGGHNSLTVSAQTHEGSIIVELFGDNVIISVAPDSTHIRGKILLEGKMQEFTK